MNDRFTRGFISGILAGIPTFIYNWGSQYFDLTTLTWSDFFGILTYGKKPESLGETLFAIAGVYLMLAFLGAIFAKVIPKVSSENYLLKIWAFSMFIWFGTLAITLLYKVPDLHIIPLKTIVTLFFGASIWGLSLGFALNWFDDRLKLSNTKIIRP